MTPQYQHASDCAIHNEPAYPAGSCDCQKDTMEIYARRWIDGPLPDDLMSDLADACSDVNYPAEERVRRIVWQALRWMMKDGAA